MTGAVAGAPARGEMAPPPASLRDAVPLPTRWLWAVQGGGWLLYTALAVLAALNEAGTTHRDMAALSRTVRGVSGFAASSLMVVVLEALRPRRPGLHAMVRWSVGLVAVGSLVWCGVYWGTSTLLGDPIPLDDPKARMLVARVAGDAVVNLITWLALYLGSVAVVTARAREEAVRHAEAEAQAAELDRLIYRTSPRVLLDTLDRLDGLIGTDRAGARLAVTRLASFLRHTLARGTPRGSTLADELDAMQDLMAVEGLRRDEPVALAVEVTADVPASRLAASAVQPFLEATLLALPGRVDAHLRVARALDRLHLQLIAAAPAGPPGHTAALRESLAALASVLRVEALSLEMLTGGHGVELRVAASLPWPEGR